MTSSRITPFLWLEGRAQEAAEFYVAVFRNALVISSTRFGAGPAEGTPPSLLSWTGSLFSPLTAILPALMQDADRGAAVIDALLQMQKPDIRRLQDAYDRG